MSKRQSIFVAILVVALAIGGYGLYRKRPVRVPVARPAPVLPEPLSPPANGVPPGGNPSAAGNEAKGVVPSGAPLLRVGETLDYAANVTKLNSTIATIQLAVVEQKAIAGKPTWHLQASAHTGNPYRMVFELDDRFDSYSDLASLAGIQYEMHLSERGQKVDSVERLLPPGRETASAGAIAARVWPGTRDPLGMLGYLRSVDWNKTGEVRSPVYDGRKLYDVRAVLQAKSEAVTVPAGKYTATKIEIHVIDNGTEMKDTHFLLYLSNDAGRMPVLLEAVLPIASARVELTKVK